MRIPSLFAALLLLVTACGEKTIKTPNGFEYTLAKKGDGIAPKKGQIVAFNYKIKDSKDSIWINTYDRGFPEVIQIADSSALATEDGIAQMLRTLSKNDSTTFNLPIKKFFKDFVKAPIPPQVDSTLTLFYDLSIVEILNEDQFSDFRTKVIAQYQKKQEVLNKVQLEKDTLAIDKFLAEKGIQASKTPSGLRYVTSQPGTGPSPQAGQTVSVNYVGTLLDGTLFDTSIKAAAEAKGAYDPQREPYSPISVTMGQGSVIQGWEEALMLMQKGGKATFYIPSTLAYGSQSRGDVIKANSILVFEMEIVDIK